MDKAYSQGFGDEVFPPRAGLSKYRCVACEVVGATNVCYFCKVPRYCSKECQRRHWKVGGHKQECKEFQNLIRTENGRREGSSDAAGSFNS